ncbi:MAG: twin-arginine translocation signal domain-containing protein [Armatimonadota bacterium]
MSTSQLPLDLSRREFLRLSGAIAAGLAAALAAGVVSGLAM